MPRPKILNPYVETIKLVLALLIGVALLLGIQTVNSWRKAAAQNEQRGQTMQATTGITKDGDASQAARREADAGTAQARDTFEGTIEEDARREPETAARDVGVVPASRLRAFEQRRLERERLAHDRLGRAGIKREARPRTEDASER